MKTPPLFKRWVLGAGLVGAIALYGLTVLNPFMGDDVVAIQDNPFIRSASNIPKIFGKSYMTRPEDVIFIGKAAVGSGLLSYRPVTTLTLFADQFVWGDGIEEFSAWGFHTTNIFLHWLDFFLFFLLAERISKHRWRSFFCALIFLAHPALSDTVNFPSYRQDMLLFAFSASAFLFWLSSRRHRGQKDRLSLAASYVCYTLALFSKETAVTFPAILFAYQLFSEERKAPGNVPHRKAMMNCLPYAGISAAYLFIWASVGSTWHQSDTSALQSVPRWFEALWKSWVIYANWLIYPGNIHTNFIGTGWMRQAFNAQSCAVWACLAIAMAAVKSRRAFFYLSFYVLALLPSVVTLPFLAARYLYWPSFGFLLLLSELVDKAILKLRSTSLRQAMIFAAVFFYAITLLSFSSMVHYRVGVLKEPLLTGQEIVRDNPEEYRAHLLMAGSYWRAQRPASALAECQEVLRLKPDAPEVFYGLLGNVYYDLQRYDEAIAAYGRSSQPNSPFLSDDYIKMGCAYAKKNDTGAALDYFNRAKNADPDNPRVYFNQAFLCFKLKDYVAAGKALVVAEGFKEDADESLRKSMARLREKIDQGLRSSGAENNDPVVAK